MQFIDGQPAVSQSRIQNQRIVHRKTEVTIDRDAAVIEKNPSPFLVHDQKIGLPIGKPFPQVSLSREQRRKINCAHVLEIFRRPIWPQITWTHDFGITSYME